MRSNENVIKYFVPSFLQPTCVPYVLDPDVGAGSEEEPVHRDEEEADHITGQRNTDEEY